MGLVRIEEMYVKGIRSLCAKWGVRLGEGMVRLWYGWVRLYQQGVL